jgi:Fur family transcriptional regulator, peroxide stress response regulator
MGNDQMNNQGQVNDFISKCRQHNLKVTPQRLLIYQELIHTKKHPNTDDIYNIVKKSFPHISFDTVYRTLLTFSQVGIADIVVGSGEPRRFDGNTDGHDHFRCLRCNQVFDIEDGYTEHFDVPQSVKD